MKNNEDKPDNEAQQEATPSSSAPVKDMGKAPPTKMQSFSRKLTRGLIYALVLFGAGLLTSYFLFQQPKVAALNEQVSTLESEKQDLEDQVAELEDRVAELVPMEAENETLTADLTSAQLQVQVLSALKDVQASQLALAQNDVDAAGLQLSRTGDKLEALRALLPSDQQGVVDGMVQRLDLARVGLAADPFAAGQDLEVLANSLIQLENTLFAEP